ncbi:MAG: hypothetical protein J0H36_03040 [Hyphomicrobium denitrificans]|jgi:hypothetical protein|nr:hypothetical protein [Hyphomicrobium denitrificans]MBN9353110.1 hypothetical protein [Hyphomicrobium denitrificans]
MARRILKALFAVGYDAFKEVVAHPVIVSVAAHIRQAQLELLCNECELDINNLADIVAGRVRSLLQVCAGVIESSRLAGPADAELRRVER